MLEVSGLLDTVVMEALSDERDGSIQKHRPPVPTCQPLAATARHRFHC
ncbi:hypothetical protein HBDW_18700 [Herbaspirillum sp. DW155]|nr:hypothetical protein HBDW_18700 [Herbaspirillum sp. DW155]